MFTIENMKQLPEQAIDRVASYFQALAEPTRLRILNLLREAGLPPAWLTADTVPVFSPVGCAHCHKGFAGRTGVFQVMPVSADMQALILQEAGHQALTRQAQREGVGSLRLAGLRKVLQGITSIEEVMALTHHG